MVHPIINIAEGDPLPEGNKLIVFSATWCPPCRQLAPVIDVVAEKINETGINCVVCKVNCDDNRTMTANYGVRQIPRVILQIEDQKIDYNGHRDSESILEWLKQYVK